MRAILRLPLAGMLLGLAAAGCTRTATPPRPNVLVLTLDTTRWDAMGFLGGEPSVTPVLDRLAAESVVFEDALTVAPLTLPSHTSLFTGLYPLHHGVRDNALFRVPAEARTLAEVLQSEGYATGAAVAAVVLDPVFGLDQGFQRYDAPAASRDPSSPWYVERPAAEMVDTALAMLEDLEPPFLFWLHLFDPHAPYLPPGAAPGSTPGPDGGPERLLQQRMLYREEVRSMDQQIGRLFQVLEERGLARDLVVVVAADHGEGLGDHGESTHGDFVFDSTMKVPLMLRHPDLEARRVAAPVSLVDVMPTLLSLLGVAGDDLAMDGLDLAPGLRGAAPFPQDRLRALESRHLYHNHGWAPYEALVSGPWKYVHSRRRALYQRVEDPGETRNQLADHPEREETLARRVEQFFGQAPTLAPVTQQLSQEEREAIEQLGYVGGSGLLETARPDFDALPAAEDRRDLLVLWEDSLAALNAGQSEAAIGILRDLVQRSPGSADFHQRLGTLLLKQGPEHLDEAEAHLLRALGIQVQRPEAHFNLGLCFLIRDFRAREDGDLARAREQGAKARVAFRACLELEPDHPEALVECGILQLREADFLDGEGKAAAAAALRTEAVARLRRFLEVAPANHVRRARCQELLAEQGG